MRKTKPATPKQVAWSRSRNPDDWDRHVDEWMRQEYAKRKRWGSNAKS